MYTPKICNFIFSRILSFGRGSRLKHEITENSTLRLEFLLFQILEYFYFILEESLCDQEYKRTSYKNKIVLIYINILSRVDILLFDNDKITNTKSEVEVCECELITRSRRVIINRINMLTYTIIRKSHNAKPNRGFRESSPPHNNVT